jgi:hypothetical protein
MGINTCLTSDQSNLFRQASSFLSGSPSRLHLVGAAIALLCSIHQYASAQTLLPPDADKTCVVADDVFKGWFADGKVTLNGTVTPADSLAFRETSECDFYRWSQRMFHWLTSQMAPTPAGTGFVFESPIFFDISPLGDDNMREFIPNVPGKIRTLAASIPQRGPLNKPVVFDKARKKLVTIVLPEVGPTGKAVIRDNTGKPIEIERARVGLTGKAVFRDKAGNRINPQTTEAGNLRLRDSTGKEIEVRPKAVTLDGQAFLLTAAGEAVDLGLGQAGCCGDITERGHALMARVGPPPGSLVYYAIQVNDVFAYLLTRNKGVVPQPNTDQLKFPTSKEELKVISDFAKEKYGKEFPHGNALVMEVKSAWIEASALRDPSQYVTITATIPTYNTSDKKKWVLIPNQTKQARLAMVGMHVVGSVFGHPEMIWATFEHINNAPSEKYSYLAGNHAKDGPPRSTGGAWLFSGVGGTINSARMRFERRTGNIVAIGANDIGPSDVLRLMPWGSEPDAAATNTDVIAINSSIRGQLKEGDVRRNYIMTGSIWTLDGEDPDNETTKLKGTKKTANTTMETFVQQSSDNCFSCHRSNKVGVSHIYNVMKPLPPP